jgi:serine/threonine-protein kinase
MKSERWRQVDELFEQALECAPTERARLLDAACAADPSLRREVEEMLSADERAEDFIETPVFGVAAALIGARRAPARASSEGVGAKRSGDSFNPSSIDESRFIPGDVLAERYRVVGLLGRGGMGEVFRADDLKLKQSVALKFLPEAFSTDGGALARFYQEVSVARQVSHRHVCRVYDVAEAEGSHFISMEYVRGESLSSLLKRIGRLPEDKAVETARQLCAGLAAVHDAGVLHRDLKPANVMIDERGDVRITDFGIAALTGDVRGAEAMAGTPAYMSPEQLTGGELTTRSDLYSLGLVLYELFTGKRAFEASSLPELMRLRQSDTQPSAPSSHVKDLDPAVERVIFRCLERDPDKRPASALQVAAALPGGDPLAAALAAGETPSPEMVAAAPKEGALRPAVAVSLLATLFVITGIVCFMSKDVGLYRMVPLDKSPEVLRDRASELVKRLGYSAPADSAYGMGVDREYLSHISDTDASPARWERLKTGQPAAIYFWYRQSPYTFDVWNTGEVMENSPALTTPGMATVTLDTLGRLRSFRAAPPGVDGAASPSEATATDWNALFVEAGLDPSRFRPSPSKWVPPHPYTARVAWEGAYTAQPETKIHVEAAAYGGRPVYFEIIDPWDRPPAAPEHLGSTRERALGILLLSVFFVAILGGTLLAWRNLRLGRGDRKGAFRLAAFIFAVFILGWVFSAHHVATEEEASNFVAEVRETLFVACVFWVIYLAFEPFVRRRWPGRIVSWSRLLAGNFRDPLVGRDILIGAVFGVGIILCQFHLSDLAPTWLGYPPREPWFDFPATKLLGLRSLAHGLMYQIYASILQPLILLLLLLLFYILLRSERLAALVLWALAALALSLTKEAPAVPFAVLAAFMGVWVLYRYGLLAFVAATFFLHLNIFYPITSEFSAWYAGDFLPALVISLALAVYGFRVSLGGRSLFRGGLLED